MEDKIRSSSSRRRLTSTRLSPDSNFMCSQQLWITFASMSLQILLTMRIADKISTLLVAFKFWWMRYSARSSWKAQFRSFNEAMMHPSSGWIFEVVLGGKHFTITFDRCGIFVSLPFSLQFSFKKMTFRSDILAIQALKHCRPVSYTHLTLPTKA